MAIGHIETTRGKGEGFYKSVILYIFDTDHLSLLQRGNEALCNKVSTMRPDELVVTVITIEEQLSGWYTLLRRAKQREKLARVYQRLTDNVKFLARLEILSFTEPANSRYESLRTLKTGIGAMDLRIAAIVLDHGAILLTRNSQDFKRIPDLKF